MYFTHYGSDQARTESKGGSALGKRMYDVTDPDKIDAVLKPIVGHDWFPIGGGSFKVRTPPYSYNVKVVQDDRSGQGERRRKTHEVLSGTGAIMRPLINLRFKTVPSSLNVKLRSLGKNVKPSQPIVLEVTEHYFKQRSFDDMLESLYQRGAGPTETKAVLFDALFKLHSLKKVSPGFQYGGGLKTSSFVCYEKSLDAPVIVRSVGDRKYVIPNIGMDLRVTSLEKGKLNGQHNSATDMRSLLKDFGESRLAAGNQELGQFIDDCKSYKTVYEALRHPYFSDFVVQQNMVVEDMTGGKKTKRSKKSKNMTDSDDWLQSSEGDDEDEDNWSRRGGNNRGDNSGNNNGDVAAQQPRKRNNLYRVLGAGNVPGVQDMGHHPMMMPGFPGFPQQHQQPMMMPGLQQQQPMMMPGLQQQSPMMMPGLQQQSPMMMPGNGAIPSLARLMGGHQPPDDHQRQENSLEVEENQSGGNNNNQKNENFFFSKPSRRCSSSAKHW